MEYVRAGAPRRAGDAYNFHVGWAGGRQHHVRACGDGATAVRPLCAAEGVVLVCRRMLAVLQCYIDCLWGWQLTKYCIEKQLLISFWLRSQVDGAIVVDSVKFGMGRSLPITAFF